MDDSGFFSVQVISRALSVWGLDLVPLQSSNPAAVRAKNSPIAANAYICNFREHWFTIRRLGSQWFNLNSLLEGAELVSNSYLGEFLAQLQTEGYDIFLIAGDLPPCDADLVLQAVSAVQAHPPRLLSDVTSSGAGKAARGEDRARAGAGGADRDEEADIEAALLLSLAETSGPGGGPANIDSAELGRVMDMQRQGGQDEMMEMALRMSQDQQQQSAVSEEDEIQKAIALSLEGSRGGGSAGGGTGVSQEEGGWGARMREQEKEEEERWLRDQERIKQEEEEQLREALRMSMDTSGGAEADRRRPAQPEVDPVHTAWPAMRNPPPGSLAAGQTTSPQKPPQTSKPSTSTSPASASTSSGAVAPGPGHRLGEAGGRHTADTSRAEDPVEIRRRRMAFLDKLQKSPTSDQSKQQ